MCGIVQRNEGNTCVVNACGIGCDCISGVCSKRSSEKKSGSEKSDGEKSDSGPGGFLPMIVKLITGLFSPPKKSEE